MIVIAAGVAVGQSPAEKARAAGSKLKNPLQYSKVSVQAGRKTYLRLCQYCHGFDGRAQANPDFESPSLRRPQDWRHGTSDGDVFVSIRDGAGHEMPPFGKQLEEKQIWELVHYIRSIGPVELKPTEKTDRQGGPQ